MKKNGLLCWYLDQVTFGWGLHLPHHTFSSRFLRYKPRDRQRHPSPDGSPMYCISPWAMHDAMRGDLRKEDSVSVYGIMMNNSVLEGQCIAVEAITPPVGTPDKLLGFEGSTEGPRTCMGW